MSSSSAALAGKRKRQRTQKRGWTKAALKEYIDESQICCDAEYRDDDTYAELLEIAATEAIKGHVGAAVWDILEGGKDTFDGKLVDIRSLAALYRKHKNAKEAKAKAEEAERISGQKACPVCIKNQALVDAKPEGLWKTQLLQMRIYACTHNQNV